MKERKYKSFWEFLVRTPINFVYTLAWILLSVFMLAVAIAIVDIINPILFWIWIAFFIGLPLGVVLRIYLIYKKI
jgi:hypothetical protein